jgi:hypothetical protein
MYWVLLKDAIDFDFEYFEWLKKFKKIYHGSKQSYTLDYNFYYSTWVMFDLNINIQSQKIHIKFNFDI